MADTIWIYGEHKVGSFNDNYKKKINGLEYTREDCEYVCSVLTWNWMRGFYTVFLKALWSFILSISQENWDNTVIFLQHLVSSVLQCS